MANTGQQDTVPRLPPAALLHQAFQWLLNRELIASTSQPGFYMVTPKGGQIGASNGLKAYLDTERTKADAAYGSAMTELADMKKRAQEQIDEMVRSKQKEADAILKLARETAQRVSLEDVQKQFGDAAKSCLTDVWI